MFLWNIERERMKKTLETLSEGINNKIKTLKRQTYGYRGQEYFKLHLYHLHNQGYSLAG